MKIILGLATLALSLAPMGLGCSGRTPSVAVEPRLGPDTGFEQIDVMLGVRLRPTLLTGFLSGGSVAELIVVDLDRRGACELVLHGFEDGGWRPVLETRLRQGMRFVDVANLAGRDRLISYEPGRLSWFDPRTESQHPLVQVDSSFEPPRPDEVPLVDVTRDLNGDGRDDLVVPITSGFAVFVQLDDGAFAEPVTVGPSPDLSRILWPDGYRYDPWAQSRVHAVDFDHDGRADLVSWNGERFEVHRQEESGRFAQEPWTCPTSVAFDSDERSWLSTGDMQGRVLHSLEDVNGDGVADLVLQVIEGERIRSKRSSYRVHYGSRVDAGTSFASEAGTVFHTDDRIHLDWERRDLDGDGVDELVLTTIDVELLVGSLWKRLKGAFGDDAWLELEFHRLEQGRFSGAPYDIRRYGLDGPPSHRERGWIPLEIVLRGATHEQRRTQKDHPRAFNTVMRLGDLTGDGREDLLFSDHPRQLRFYFGTTGPGAFSQHTRDLRLAVPNDEEYIRLVDLDRDGREEILMHHPFTRRDPHGGRIQAPGTESHRVTILMAR